MRCMAPFLNLAVDPYRYVFSLPHPLLRGIYLFFFKISVIYFLRNKLCFFSFLICLQFIQHLCPPLEIQVPHLYTWVLLTQVFNKLKVGNHGSALGGDAGGEERGEDATRDNGEGLVVEEGEVDGGFGGLVWVHCYH